MKRFAPALALAFLLSVLVLPLWAAEESGAAPSDRSPAASIAGTITAVTGMAISPLLGTGVYGAYLYFSAAEEGREALPWFAQMKFWLPALALVAAAAAKDALGAAVPAGWKKPLDVIETLENKATGLVAAGAVVPFTVVALSKMILGDGQVALAPAMALPGGLATLHVAALDLSWLLNVLTVPFGLAVYAVVWMASHAINGLILLSPWGVIDAALKAARTGLLGLLTLTSALDPWIGAALSGVVIVISYFVAGWSFRLTVFSAIFSWDFFTGRKGRFQVEANGNQVFAGVGLGTAPQRTYGRLVRAGDGVLQFVYRPWLVLAPRTVAVPAAGELAVGRGAFFSDIHSEQAEVFVLPPRYRTHEDALAQVCGLARGVEPIGLNRAWSWLTAALGFRAGTA